MIQSIRSIAIAILQLGIVYVLTAVIVGSSCIGTIPGMFLRAGEIHWIRKPIKDVTHIIGILFLSTQRLRYAALGNYM